MKFHFALLTLLIAALFATTACNKSTNPQMQAPPEQFVAVDQSVPQLTSAKEPKVNILFVVDNSGSMKAHQEKLKANIDKFADRFFDNPRIDYKIGVVPVYDRIYPLKNKLNDPVEGPRERSRKMNPLGELVQLKDKNGQVIEGVPYITRDTPHAKEVLKSTVAIGIQWGPEAEESFSPVLKVVQDEKHNQEVNAGFYDKDAYLVVIFLTDADDVTPGLTSDEFYSELVQAKGGNTQKVLIAAALPSVKVDSPSCRLDGNGPQYKFPALITRSEGMMADLCSNSFGEALAIFGEQLVNQVGAQKIKLGYIVDKNIVVTYGTKDTAPEKRQQIQEGPNGYTLFPATGEIVLSSKLNIKRVDGGEIFVSVTPANLANIRTGRLKTTLDPKAEQKAAKKP